MRKSCSLFEVQHARAKYWWAHPPQAAWSLKGFCKHHLQTSAQFHPTMVSIAVAAHPSIWLGENGEMLLQGWKQDLGKPAYTMRTSAIYYNRAGTCTAWHLSGGNLSATGWSKETVTNESVIKSLQKWFSLISGVFLGSTYWAVCVSKWHCIKTGIFGWYRQFIGVPLSLKAIFKKIGKTQNWHFIHISLCDPVCWSIKIDFCVTQMGYRTLAPPDISPH